MSLDAELASTGEWAHLGEWECMECGYIEEGVKTKRPQVCPDCGAPGQALEFFPYGDDDQEDWDDSGPDIQVRAGVDSPGDVFDDEVEHLR